MGVIKVVENTQESASDINWAMVNKEMDAAAVENLRCELLKLIQERKRQRGLILDQKNRYKKLKMKVQSRIDDYADAARKAQMVISIMETDAELLRSKFFEKRG
jgi:hypothetical protein